MNESSQDAASGDAQQPRVMVALLFMVLLCALMRLHTIVEPLERDITTYAIIGAEMAQGRVLYSDLWDNKPPGIHLTYMFGAMLAGGANPYQVYFINVIGAVITLLGVYVAASRSGMGAASGLWAAGAWTIVSMNMELQANQPNTELFINAALVWMFAVLQGHGDRQLPWRSIVLAGALAATGTIYKHVAVLSGAGMALAYALGATGPRPARWGRAITMGAVVAVAWGLMWCYFAAGGRDEDFVDAVIRFNAAHAPSVVGTFAYLVFPRNHVFLWVAMLPATVGLIAAGRGAWEGELRHFKLMIGFAIGTLLAVALPGHWFYHYYQLWLAPLCIALGWSYVLLCRLCGTRRRWVAPVVAGTVMLPILLQQVQTFFVSPLEWATIKYGDMVVYPYERAIKLGRLLKPQETFFLFGDDTCFYWVTGRRPPTGAVFHYSLTQPPMAKRVTERALKQLDVTRPDALVFGRWFKSMDMARDRSWYRKHPIYHWAQQHYRKLPAADPQGFYEYFVRRGSDLDLRLTRSGAEL